MAYDELLAGRIRTNLSGHPGLNEKKMFGGVGYILNGNMACGVHKDYLIVRVGPAQYEDALNQPHTREFDMTGRPMKGWIMVAAEGCASEDDLEKWIQKGAIFAQTLPPK